MGKSIMKCLLIGLVILLAVALWVCPAETQNTPSSEDIDARVRQFLDSRRWSWGSWGGGSVPEVDGQALYNIIVEHGYKRALEIGTGIGHSGIWIAWALSQTGGRLITIEIDKYNYEQALKNFREVGLAKYIDARLGDAHKLVPELPGPFDFVFCDADKDWYKNYLDAVLPKLTIGGCFAAHNVADFGSTGGFGGRFGRSFRGGFGRGFGAGPWGYDFLEYARSIPNLETKVLDLRGSHGLSVSYKVAEK